MVSIRQMFSRRAVCMLLALVFTLSAFSFAADSDSGRHVKNRVTPVYPEMARKLNVSGTVKLEVTIASNGSVRNVKVLGGHPMLAEAAISAVKQWRYDAGDESVQIVDVKFNIE